MRKLPWVLILVISPSESKYVQRDLDKVKATYLIVAPPAFADSLDALCDHRSKAHTVAVVRTDDIAAKHGPGAEGIAKLVAAARPEYLLLAGDADTLPPFIRKSEYKSEKFASDADLATDHPFGAIAGRFPADTADELKTMIAKTIEYETTLKPGRWQKKIAFLAGEGGFGAVIDTILEHQVSAIVTNAIPPAYDVELAYAKPDSKYCCYPPRFQENAVRLLNEGVLFFTYVGHGARTHFDDILYKESAYPIFDAKGAAKVDAAAGLPVMVAIACNTGEFDSKAGDCIGEELFKRRRGPAAFIGGSRVTQPYANALLGNKLVEAAFRHKTLGRALWDAKARVVEKGDDSKIRKQADFLAALVQGADALAPMRKDVILHYNLLGDPALVLRRPSHEISLTFAGTRPGGTITVRGSTSAASVEVTLECPRDKFCRPVDLNGDAPEKAMARRYANANDKVILRKEAAAYDGAFETELELPATLKPGKYWVKVYAPAAIGAKELDVGE